MQEILLAEWNEEMLYWVPHGRRSLYSGVL